VFLGIEVESVIIMLRSIRSVRYGDGCVSVVGVYLGIAREKSAKLIEVGVDSLPPSLLSFLVVLHGSKGSIMVGGCWGNLGDMKGIEVIGGGVIGEGLVVVHDVGGVWSSVEEGVVVGGGGGGGGGGVWKELKKVRVVHGEVVHEED